MNNIVTIEQADLIRSILHKDTWQITHRQYSEILTLADELGKFNEAVTRAGSISSIADAETYKDELINEILIQNENENEARAERHYERLIEYPPLNRIEQQVEWQKLK
jgi:hypothetical protein